MKIYEFQKARTFLIRFDNLVDIQLKNTHLKLLEYLSKKPIYIPDAYTAHALKKACAYKQAFMACI